MADFPGFKLPTVELRVSVKLPELIFNLNLQLELFIELIANLDLLDNIFEVFGSASLAKVRAFEEEQQFAIGLQVTNPVVEVTKAAVVQTGAKGTFASRFTEGSDWNLVALRANFTGSVWANTRFNVAAARTKYPYR